MVMEGFVVGLPDGQRMLSDGEGSKLEAGGEGGQGGSGRQLDFHAPIITDGREAVVAKERVSGFIRIVQETLDRHAGSGRGQGRFSLGALGYFCEQSRANAAPLEVGMNAAIGLELSV